MSKNKLNSRNEVINNILKTVLKNSDAITNYNALDKKLERILKMESLNNNLLEQLFCNHGFAMNMNKKEDLMLKELYEDLRKKYIVFMD